MSINISSSFFNKNDSRKKILYVTTISSTINCFLIPHIKMLCKEGYQVDIMTNVVDDITDSFILKNCHIYDVPMSRNPFSFQNIASLFEMIKILENQNYNLIHTHTPIASFLIRLANKKTTKTRVIYTAHGFHFYKGAPLKNWLFFYPIEKMMVGSQTEIITINEEDYNVAKNKIRPNKTHYVRGVGIDLSRFQRTSEKEERDLRRQLNVDPTNFVLFYAAELNTNKNQAMIIKSVGKLEEEIPNIHLYLAGEGDQRKELEYLASELEISEKVTFLGQVSNVDKWLKITDLVVASSKREGLPVNVMEGLASGIPIVATDIRGHRDIIENDRNGYLIEVDDVVQMASKIQYLYENSEKRQMISRQNILDSEKFGIESILKDLKKIYINSLSKYDES